MKTLVIAPHPDDEVLGCGGTLLRRKSEGIELAWLIVTGISETTGWSTEMVRQRDDEIDKVNQLIGFDRVFNLRLPSTKLDQLPFSELVNHFSVTFKAFQPEEILVPHRSDVHTDHQLVFDATASCTKWFRHPFVKRVLAYETISETEFCLDPNQSFKPNYFVDISDFLERKLEVLSVYKSELGTFPFPRSMEVIKALAVLRGANSGFMVAEAFQLLRERQ